MRLAKLITYLSFCVLVSVSSVHAQELEGPLEVCENECYDYYYSGENGGPYFWTVEGGIIEDNRGSEVNICWEEVQTASIQILNASVSQTIPELDISITITTTPETDIIFPLYPLCQTEKDSMQSPDVEYIELENCKTVCPGSIVTYFPTGSEQYERQWIVEGHQNIDSDSLSSGTVHWNEEGYGSILLIEYTEQGCVDSSFYCIEILDQPDVNLQVLNSNIDLNNLCKNQEIYLKGSSDQALSYEWLTDDGQQYFGTETSISFPQSGSYTISLVTTTECFCVDTTTLAVQVIDDVVPVIDCAGTTCAGEEQTYYATDICGSYNWSVSSEGTVTDGGQSADNYITVVWNGSSLGTLSLSTSACDESNICTGTTEIVIPIMGANLEIEGPVVVCKSGSASYSVPNFSGANYNWTIAGNGYVSEGWGTNSITVTWDTNDWSGDNSTIEVSIDNCFLDCSSSSTKAVELKEEFYISTSESACEGDNGYIVAVVGYEEILVDWEMIAPDGTATTLATDESFYSLRYVQGPGRYEFIAKEKTGDYCNSEDRVSITVYPSPEIPKEIIGAEYICIGESYQYKVEEVEEHYEYLWEIKDGTTTERLVGSEVLATWTSVGPYEVTVYSRDIDTRCASEELILLISEAAGGTLEGDGISCIDQKGFYAITGVLPHNIDWLVTPASAGTIGILTDGEIAVHWHESGEHRVTADYCGKLYEIEVDVLPPPSLAVNAPDGVCVGEKVEVTFSGPAGSSYLVYDEEENPVTRTTTDPALLSAGYYGVELTDANGCTARESFYLDSYEKPAINLSSVGWHQLCIPGGTATLESVVMNDALSYQWYKDDVPVGIDSPKHLADGEGLYKLVVTNPNGCTAEESKLLECRESGGVCDCRSDGGTRFSIVETSFCNVYDFQNTSFDFIPGTLRYNFGDPDSGADNFSTDENPSHTFTKAGHYIVSLTAEVNSTNVPGETCLARYQAYVTVEAVADFDHVSACMQEDIKFEELSNFLEDYSITSYEWNFGDPTSGTANSSTLENPIHVFDSPGLYPVTLTVTTDAGCKAALTKEIEIYGTPLLDFNLPFSKCIAEGLEFVLSSPSMFELEWDFGDTTSGAANTSSNQAPIHSFMTAGTYTIDLKGVSIYGCEQSISKTITVSENTLAGDIMMDKSMPMCLGETVSLTAPAGGIAYLWSTGETTEEIIVAQSGIYSVTITGSNVCDYVPDAVIVNTIKPIDPYIWANVEGENRAVYNELAICQGEVFSLRTRYIFNSTNSWSTGETGYFVPYSTLSALAPGEHLIELSVTDDDTGCVIAAEPFKLTIYPRPEAVTISSNQPDNCEGPEFTFIVVNPQADHQYFWNNGLTGTSITVARPGFYYVTVISPEGCTRTSNLENIYPLPNTDSFLTGCQEVCFPKTLCVGQNSGFVSDWQWLLDGQPIAGPEGTAATLEATEIGEYQVVLTSVYGCENTSGVLALSPETNQQTLSGMVYIDEDGDGAFSVGEQQLSGIKVRVVSGNTIIQETTTDQVGSYVLDPLQTSEARIEIDTTGLDFSVDPSEMSYEFQLVDCIEDLTQDFPLTKNCKKVTEQVVVFTCDGEQASFEGQLYAVTEKDTFYRLTSEGCDSLVYLEVEAYPEISVQPVTTTTCPGEANGSLELMSASSPDLTYSLNGAPFTSDVVFSGLPEGAHSIIVQDSYSCESEILFSIAASSLPQVSLVVDVDCDDNGKLIIDNLGNENLTYAVDGTTTFDSSLEIENLNPGPHVLTIQDENGCTVEESFVVNSYMVPVVDFTSVPSCFDGLSGSIQISATSSPNLVYAVDNPSGFAAEDAFTGVPVGNHILYVEDMAGCIYEYPFVIATVPTPVYSTSPTNSCAEANTGALDITTTELGLTFSLDDLTYTTDLEFKDLAPGAQTLYIKTIDGCILEEPFMIENFVAPVVNVTTENSCYDLSTGMITATSQNAQVEYALDGNPFSIVSSFDNLASGLYDLTIKDENDCEQAIEVAVDEKEELQVDFIDVMIDCNAGEAELEPIIIRGENVTFSWSDGSTEKYLATTASGTYSVEVSDGCRMETYTWDVQIEPQVSTDLYMPTIFDPSDQGKDGSFKVQFSDDLNVTKFELRIMDKWGNNLYRTKDYLAGWDGRVNNSSLDPGVYLWMYIAEYEVCNELNEVQEVGSVTIIK